MNAIPLSSVTPAGAAGLPHDADRVSAPTMRKALERAVPQALDGAERTAAETRLAEIPLDGVPEPRHLASPSWMPWPRNPLFTGRKGALAALAAAIKAGGPAVVVQDGAGDAAGGAGKTQIAVEFAYRYAAWFKGGVFWFDCGEGAAMAEIVAACGPALYPADAGFATRPLPERVTLVAAALASDMPRLLVFDNCDDEAVLDTWAPRQGSCRLLVTTRRLIGPRGSVDPVSLGRLTRTESCALLRAHGPDVAADDAAVESVAEDLGDWPLALTLAARQRVVRDDGIEAAPPLAAARDAAPHATAVDRTFAAALRRLHPDRPADLLAGALFARAAWFAPGYPLPLTLLRRCTPLAQDETAVGTTVTVALARLHELALVERAGPDDAIAVHPRLATLARERMPEAATARQAVESAVVAEAHLILDRRDIAGLAGWVVHLVSIALAAAREGSAGAVALLVAAGAQATMVGDFERAQAMLRSALGQAKAAGGATHPEVATILEDLGAVQRACGDRDGALTSRTRALAIKEDAYGSDHPAIARSLGDLGQLQSEMGDLNSALVSQTRALAITQVACGPAHPDVASVLTDLAVVQHQRGDIDAALAHHQGALAIREASLGVDHPEVARSLGFIGGLHAQRGDWDGALSSQTRALSIRETALGLDHPDIARNLHELAVVQRARGDIDAALAARQRALTIVEAAHGPDHPETGRILGAIGVLHADRGDWDAAVASQTRAATIAEATGGDNADLARALGDLGRVQRERRDHGAAASGLGRALAVALTVHGPEHPVVAGLRGDLLRLESDRPVEPAPSHDHAGPAQGDDGAAKTAPPAEMLPPSTAQHADEPRHTPASPSFVPDPIDPIDPPASLVEADHDVAVAPKPLTIENVTPQTSPLAMSGPVDVPVAVVAAGDRQGGALPPAAPLFFDLTGTALAAPALILPGSADASAALAEMGGAAAVPDPSAASLHARAETDTPMTTRVVTDGPIEGVAASVALDDAAMVPGLPAVPHRAPVGSETVAVPPHATTADPVVVEAVAQGGDQEGDEGLRHHAPLSAASHPDHTPGEGSEAGGGMEPAVKRRGGARRLIGLLARMLGVSERPDS